MYFEHRLTVTFIAEKLFYNLTAAEEKRIFLVFFMENSFCCHNC